MSSDEIQKDMDDLMKDHLGIWRMDPLARCCASMRVLKNSFVQEKGHIQEKLREVCQEQLKTIDEAVESRIDSMQGELARLEAKVVKAGRSYRQGRIRVLTAAVREGVDDARSGYGPPALSRLLEEEKRDTGKNPEAIRDHVMDAIYRRVVMVSVRLDGQDMLEAASKAGTVQKWLGDSEPSLAT